MKRTLIALIGMLLVLAAASSFAQDRYQIKVKKAQVVTGVVIIDVLQGAKTVELQCNDGQPTCKNLKTGDYWMVVLPKNWGMYDCQNAEVYPGDKDPGEEPDSNARVGAYCLIEK